VDPLTALAGAIVQAAGADAYKDARRMLGRALGRLGKRKHAEAELDATHERILTDPGCRQEEVRRWVAYLQSMTSTSPEDLDLVRALHAEISGFANRPEVSQMGWAGRDQYNITGNPLIINRYSNDTESTRGE
jgi:hypothetical protein